MHDCDQVTILARFRRGVVREAQRVCHIVPVPESTPDELTAYCGMSIRPGQAELVNGTQGMPCVLCLASLPRSHRIGPGG
jgi:hypothetical protein